MSRVPSQYLDWAAGQPWVAKAWPAVAEYIERSRKAIDQDLERAER